MDCEKIWNNYKSLLAITKTNDDDAVKNFLDQLCSPTEDLTNSATLSELFALALNINNFETLEYLLKFGVRAIPDQKVVFIETILQSAVISGNMTLISEIIEFGVDCNAVDKDGNTFLHLAFQNNTCDWRSTEAINNKAYKFEAERAIIKIFDILVDSGINVNVKNQNEETPLSLAIKFRMMKVTDYLVQHNAELNIVGKSVSHCLVQDEIEFSFQQENADGKDKSSTNQENLEFMDWWFSKKLDLDSKYSEMTLFEWAARHMLKHVLLMLLNYTDDIDFVNERGCTLLHILLYSVMALSKLKPNENHVDSCIDIVKILMNRGVSVNHIDKNGNTPFHLAAKLNNVNLMQIMLRKFTNVNACDSAKQTVLHIVTKNCTEKHGSQYLLIISALVTKGADINKQDHSGKTALHYACENQKKYSKATIEFFATQGCNLNIGDEKGRTALHMCISTDRIDLFETLINHGADINLKFIHKNHQTTALHVATEKQLVKIVEILLKAGFDPDTKDELGNTALHIDIVTEKVPVAKILLKMGADPNLQDKANRSPLRKVFDKANPFGMLILMTSGASFSEIDRSMVMSHRSCKKLAIVHLVLLKAAGLPVPVDYDGIVQIQGDLETVMIDKDKELDLLKSTQIDGITLYDFLHMNLKMRYYYSKKENLKNYLMSHQIRNDFMLYAGIVLGRYWTAVHRMPLLESAKNAWYRITDVYLPEITVEYILSYLQNWELRLVIKAGA